MTVNENKIYLPGIHQCVTLTNEYWKTDAQGELTPTGDELILLFHGYSESADKIYKRLGRSLNEKLHNGSGHKRYSLMALNGLYPLPKHFPLDGKKKEDEELLAGFAWYFYDQRTDSFLIDYQVPVHTITSYLKKININDLPTSFIGYSQGGYLAPFVGLSYGPTTQVMGINCSFRFDLIKELYAKVPIVLNQIQGSEDDIIDRELSELRFQQLKEHYQMTGDYHRVEGSNHWLTPDTRECAIEVFMQSLSKEIL